MMRKRGPAPWRTQPLTRGEIILVVAVFCVGYALTMVLNAWLRPHLAIAIAMRLTVVFVAPMLTLWWARTRRGQG